MIPVILSVKKKIEKGKLSLCIVKVSFLSFFFVNIFCIFCFVVIFVSYNTEVILNIGFDKVARATIFLNLQQAV